MVDGAILVAVLLVLQVDGAAVRLPKLVQWQRVAEQCVAPPQLDILAA